MARCLAIRVRVSGAVAGLGFIRHANSVAGGVSGIYTARRVGSLLQIINGSLRRRRRMTKAMRFCEFSVTVDPGIPCIATNQAGGYCVLDSPPMTVTVRGDWDQIGKRVIRSGDRYIQYEESDLFWALPLGFCRVERDPFEQGDQSRLSAFGQFPYDADLVCIRRQEIETHGPGKKLMASVVFQQVSGRAGRRWPYGVPWIRSALDAIPTP